jgi:glycosyltransferase involved in cell wall biosynthesis
MSSNNKFVSVIMSTYNSINTLDTAIESIMNQTYQNLELLIMDDCSEDGSYEKINYYKDRFTNIKIFRNKKNLGLTKSLNFLIQNSSGYYIARQDADDISFDKRIEDQVREMVNFNLDFCTTRAFIKNTRKKIPGISYYFPSKIISKLKNPFIHGTLMIRKDSIIKAGLYNENFYYAQDYKLITDMFKRNYKYRKLNKPLYMLNMENNISSNKKKEQNYYASCVKNDTLPDLNIEFN